MVHVKHATSILKLLKMERVAQRKHVVPDRDFLQVEIAKNVRTMKEHKVMENNADLIHVLQDRNLIQMEHVQIAYRILS